MKQNRSTLSILSKAIVYSNNICKSLICQTEC